MSIGDRIHHTRANERPGDLVVEAYDDAGVFLPSVPILIEVIADDGVLKARSDWTFVEAAHTGQGVFRATWACSNRDAQPVEARMLLLISHE